jgi:autotransporter-associated beta strand protein
MNTRRIISASKNRPSICTASIAAFLAAASVSPGVPYNVDLGAQFTEPGLLTGGTSVEKTGLGALFITNPANTFTGATSIFAGSIVITNAGQLGGASGSPVTVFGNITQGSDSGQLLIGGGAAPQTFALPEITISGGGPGGNGVALLSVGNNTLTGGVATTGTVTTRLGSTYGLLSLSSFSTVSPGSVAVLQGNGHFSLTGLSGPSAITKQGTGTLVLSGTNLNTGIIQLDAGGSIRVSSNTNLGTSTAANGFLFNSNSATLGLEIRTDAPDFGARNLSVASNNGAINVDRAVSSSLALINQTVNLGNLTWAADRNFTVNGRNGYGVTLNAAAAGAGAGQNTLANTSNGTLTVTGNLWNINDGTARVLTLNAANANSDIVVNGNILAISSVAHAVTKTGTGTLTLNGTASTYGGPTNINGGTLAVRQIAGGLGTASSAAAINIGTGGTAGTLTYLGAAGTGAGETVARPINLAGTTGAARINASQSGSAPTALILTNVTNPLTGSGTKTLTLGGTSTLDNEITSAINNQGTGTFVTSVVKADAGTWVLSGTNTYTGSTTISNGTLKLKANAPASTVLDDASQVVFNVDATTQAAGGRLVLSGLSSGNTVENLGIVNPILGHGTISAQNAGFETKLAIAGLSAASGSIGASVNFQAPTALDVITVAGAPVGFLRGNTYINGSNFAYVADVTGLLRTPVYGTDAGFVTSASALTPGSHNEITGSFSAAATTISSLKITGDQTLTLTGTLGINTGAGTVGGIIVDGATGSGATISGTGITQGLGAGANGGALVIRVAGASDLLTLNAPITNSTTQGLSKNGLGTLILAGTNNQAGPTNINEGTVMLAGTGRLSATNQVLNIRQGATLDLNGVSQGNVVGQFNGAGTITNTGAFTANLSVGNNNQAGTWAGVIQDGANSISMTKQGTGGQTWSGLSTYTGPTTINSTGILTVTNLANIGSPSAIGSGNAANDASNAASLVFGGNSTTNAQGGISYTGTESVSIDRLFTLANTVATGGAGVRIQANGANNAVLIFNKTNPIAYTAGGSTVAQNLVLGGASTGDNQINLQLVNPTGGPASAVLNVVKADAGTWVLGNTANTYTGSTAITAGRLVAQNGFSLPTTSPVTLAGSGVLQSTGSLSRAFATTAVNGAGTVTWLGSGGFSAGDTKLTVNVTGTPAWGSSGFLPNTGVGGTAASTLVLSSTTALAETEYAGNIDVTTTGISTFNRTIQVDDNTSTTLDYATISGVISGAIDSSAALSKAGAGTLYLTGANTYTGSTNLAAGVLGVTTVGGGGPSSSLGAAGNALNLNAGRLDYVGTGESASRTINLNASATVDAGGSGALVLSGLVTGTGTAARTLTIQGLNTDANEITSVIANPSGSTAVTTVTKGGGGTWILSGANTYSGTTTAGSGNLGLGLDSVAGVSGPTGIGTLTLTNGNLFADGGDRTITNLLNMVNATGGLIGVNSLTVNGPAQFNGGNFTLNNNLLAGEQFLITGPLTNSEAGTARTYSFGGTGLNVLQGGFGQAGTAAANLQLNSGTVHLAPYSGVLPANSYTGATTINGGTLKLLAGAGAILPNGVGKGNVTFGNTAIPALLDLNGRSEGINGLTGTSTGVKTIDNSSVTAAALSIGNNNGAVNFNGDITNSGGGPVSITKAGTAAGTLSGTNLSYTGTTTVQTGGSLAFPNGAPTATSGITVAGNAGLSLFNDVGTPISGLTLLDLGGGGGTTQLSLDLGPTSDTLTTSGAAVTAGTISFAFNGLPGFGAGAYTLLESTAAGFAGATYTINKAPGGFTYTIDTSDPNKVRLVASDNGAQTFYWAGDVDTSWSTYLSGSPANTNWVDLGGAEIGSNPGSDDNVIFSSQVATAALPVGAALVTTLDSDFRINSLGFNGQTAGTAAAVVGIASGTGGSLTIQPAVSSDGISLPGPGGASISAPVILGSDQTWNVGTTGAVRPLLTVSGVMSGTGNLTKTGLGTVTLTGVNTRTSRTIISAGTVMINAEAALGANPAVPTANQLEMNGATSNVRFTAATVLDDANRGIFLGANGGGFDTTPASATVASAVVISGPGALRKLGGNTLALNGANSYAGGTIISGGAVRAGDDAALGSAGVTMNNSGTILEVGDGVTLPTTNSVTIADTGNDKAIRLLAGATSGAVTGNIIISELTVGNVRAQASGSGILTLSGVISNTGTAAAGIRVNELVANTGVVVLGNANTYFGPTSVLNGTLRTSVNAAIPSASAVTVNANFANATATLDLNGNSNTIGSLTYGGSTLANTTNNVTTGAGTLTLGGNVTTTTVGAGGPMAANLSGNVDLGAATRTFTVAETTNAQADLLVSANIVGGAAIGLTKAGPGTMQMTGTSTYGGTTTVNAGTLLVDGSISGAVTVAGGTLGGVGSVGAIVANSGTVAPGASIGTLSATSLTMNGSSTFSLEINSNTLATDLLSTTGPLTLDVANTVFLSGVDGGASTLTLGQKFTFITYNGTWNGGLFRVGGVPILDDATQFTLGVNTYSIDYNLDGNKVALVVVPEPGIAASLLGGFGMLVGLQRIRRRNDRRA